jgi:putative nucleotidyltransferase with HDIG domain
MAANVAEQFLEEVMEELESQRLVLPTLPEVALRVRDVVDDENASLNAVTRVIASDAALSARLIHVANSPLLRGSRIVETLDEAVTRLGMRLIRDMAISMVMEQMFQATSDLTDQKLRQVWEHSTEVAAICHALASQFTKLRPEQAMLAGLVHDIGMLPLLTKAEDHPELLEAEAELDRLLWLLHPRVGKAILEAWDFPPELVRVAAEHEKLDRASTEVDYVDVVIVANLQSRLGTDHAHAEVDWAAVPAVEKLGLSADVNIVEMEETAQEIREVESLLRSWD